MPAAGRVSGGEPDDFEFRASIDLTEEFVDSKHRGVLQFRFSALRALENR